MKFLKRIAQVILRKEIAETAEHMALLNSRLEEYCRIKDCGETSVLPSEIVRTILAALPNPNSFHAEMSLLVGREWKTERVPATAWGVTDKDVPAMVVRMTPYREEERGEKRRKKRDREGMECAVYFSAEDVVPLYRFRVPLLMSKVLIGKTREVTTWTWSLTPSGLRVVDRDTWAKFYYFKLFTDKQFSVL